MKKLLMWFLLLNKRLYKKITYIGILLLVPILVFLFSLSARESGSVVTVVLAREDPGDAFSAQIIEELQRDSIVISFQESSPETAIELVSAGKADAAWIFPADMHGRLWDYVYEEKGSDGFVRVVEREQTVPLRLAREKLTAAVHKQSVKITFLKYIREVAPESQQISDQELLTYLENTDVSGELFAFYDIYGNRREETANFLTTPIRGLLAVLATVSAVVTAMYYQSDLDNGIFSLLPERHRVFGEFGYQMISAVNILFVVTLALWAAGLSAGILTELLICLLFGICCALFGMLMRAVFGGGRGLAVLLPVLVIVMLAVCPVFFDFGQIRKLQFLLPPTYYINSPYNDKYFTYLALYDMILLILYAAVTWLKDFCRKMRKQG